MVSSSLKTLATPSRRAGVSNTHAALEPSRHLLRMSAAFAARIARRVPSLTPSFSLMLRSGSPYLPCPVSDLSALGPFSRDLLVLAGLNVEQGGIMMAPS